MYLSAVVMGHNAFNELLAELHLLLAVHSLEAAGEGLASGVDILAEIEKGDPLLSVP